MMLARMTAIGLAGSAAALSGCASYETYPAAPKNAAINDPNTLSMQQVMSAGLAWVAAKYPPGGQSVEALATGQARPQPFAINLPQGTLYRSYERIAEAVGQGAQPLSADNSHLPIYHVSYARVRGDEAQVHVIRPVASLGTSPEGTPIPQEIKIQLRGGLRPWHVVAWREWQVGTAETPELNFYTPPNTVVEIIPSKSHDDAFVPNPKPRTAVAPE